MIVSAVDDNKPSDKNSFEKNSLFHPSGALKAGKFTIVDVYRYEGNSDPADEASFMRSNLIMELRVS